MPRQCRPGLLGLCIALALAAGGVAAAAQTATLMRPALDGDPLDPPRFARPEDRRRTPRTQTFGNPPASGAGLTGFHSANRPRRPPAKARAAVPPPVPVPVLPDQAPAAAARAAAVVTAQQPPPATGGFTPLPASPPRKRPPPDLEPFDAVGVRAGAFLVKPAIELTGGYDSNPARSLHGTGSGLYTVAPELLVQSLWSRHELRADLRGSYTGYQEMPSLDRPYFDGKVTGRVDVSRDTRIDLDGRWLLSTDNPGSPNLQADLARLPAYNTLSAGAGVAHRFNRFEVALKGTVERTTYEESELTDGTRVSNDDRNFSQYGAQLRGSYELTPGVKPFVEVGADTRVHDEDVNCFCEMRDSRGNSLRAGSTFELTRLLTGEISAGWLTRTYDDPALPELNGFLFDGSLLWSATALTTVRFTAKSAVDETTLTGVSGIFRRDFGLQVDHAFRRWLIATARLGYGYDTYPGSPREDTRYLASAQLTYKATRTLHVKGEFRQEWLRSNLAGNDYTASVFLLGLRLQR